MLLFNQVCFCNSTISTSKCLIPINGSNATWYYLILICLSKLHSSSQVLSSFSFPTTCTIPCLHIIHIKKRCVFHIIFRYIFLIKLSTFNLFIGFCIPFFFIVFIFKFDLQRHRIVIISINVCLLTLAPSISFCICYFN